MPICGNCSGHITRDFIRVFGAEGEVYGCPQCMTYRELYEGDGAARSGDTPWQRFSTGN